mmetsp:Transcript_87628/g.249227  ORF Transcript_87628/g.249227 Transcript_87628/m.249227 type:complete len:205 (+) Transcript_87628:337-951(+)
MLGVAPRAVFHFTDNPMDNPPARASRHARRVYFYSSSFTFFAFLGRGSLHPRARSSLLMTCGLGMAFPASYCWITCGFSLIAVPSCFWFIFFASRACMIALLSDLSTVRCLSSSVSLSSLAAPAPSEFTDEFAPPIFRSICPPPPDPRPPPPAPRPPPDLPPPLFLNTTGSQSECVGLFMVNCVVLCLVWGKVEGDGKAGQRRG